jgi:formamidopyrimidine-DNA glycosylase
MPELPDVEIFKRIFDANALGKRIASVRVFDHRILADTSTSELRVALERDRFVESRRVGKVLLARLSGGDWLSFHFGMTGFFKAFTDLAEDTEHDSVRFDFEDGVCLAYDSTRKLGEIRLVQDPDSFLKAKGVGMDPLDPEMTADRFVELVSSSRGRIKPRLMRQDLVAGLGNIYSDEVLYQAGIHPKTAVQDLDREDLVRIYEALHTVIETAVEHQADPDRFPDWFLIPRRHSGGRCPVCSRELEVVEVSGRRGYACPGCQPRVGEAQKEVAGQASES